MTLIINLKKTFNDFEKPLQECYIDTSTSHDKLQVSNDSLIYGDVRPFNNIKSSDYLNTLLLTDVKKYHQYRSEGEFAFLKINRTNRTIIFSKDFTGTKNLFYAFEDGELIVSPNIYDVLSHLKVRKFNLNACLEYIYYEYIGAPKTLFEGVQSIRHSETVIYGPNANLIERINNDQLSEVQESRPDDWPKKLRGHIVESHEKRITNKNGIYLSGGIDSTVMGITLRRDLALGDVLGVTFSTKGAENDESRYAIQAARELNIHLETIAVNPAEPVDLFSLIEKSNFPYFGGIILSSVGENLKSKGIYGYNIFAGQDSRVHTPPYNPVDNIILNKLADWPHTRSLLSAAAKLLKSIPTQGKIGKTFDRLSHASNIPEYLTTYFQHLHRHSKIPKSQYFETAYQEIIESISKNLNKSRTNLSIANSLVDVSLDRQHWCDMDYMTKSTEAFGCYASMPFFDREFSLFSASLPISLKMKMTAGRAGHTGKTKYVNKYCLREAYKGELSNALVFRDKAVCITNHLYLNGCLSPYVSDFFRKSRLKEIGLAQKLNIEETIDRARAKSGTWGISDYDDVVEVQNILFLEIIARKFNLQN